MHTRDPQNPDDSQFVHPAHVSGMKAESGDFMTLHQGPDPESRKVGYELKDANVKDTAIFLVVLAAAVAIVFVVAFGMGKLIYSALGHQDGATNHWSQLAGAKPANLESNPVMEQQQLNQIVKKFPEPRLQTDDGNMDVAEMHAREDMLLNYYSWADEQKQAVRIPIARAMQLLAQRGLPVEGQAAGQQNEAAQASGGQTMVGDGSNAVTRPLTDGFARTGPELQMMEARQQQLLETGSHNGTQAKLNAAHESRATGAE